MKKSELKNIDIKKIEALDNASTNKFFDKKIVKTIGVIIFIICIYLFFYFSFFSNKNNDLKPVNVITKTDTKSQVSKTDVYNSLNNNQNGDLNTQISSLRAVVLDNFNSSIYFQNTSMQILLSIPKTKKTEQELIKYYYNEKYTYLKPLSFYKTDTQKQEYLNTLNDLFQKKILPLEYKIDATLKDLQIDISNLAQNDNQNNLISISPQQLII
jgi:hypothetical protein